MAVLVLFAVASLAVTGEYAASYGKSYPGVKMRDVALGGRTPEELLATLSRASGGGRIAEYTFTARLPFAGASTMGPEGTEARGETRDLAGRFPREFTLRSSELGVAFSTRQTAHRAYAVGRGGPLGEQLAERLLGRFSGQPVCPAIGYDEDLAAEAVAAIARQVDVEPADASVRIEGGAVDLVEHADGVEVDQAGTLDGLAEALPALERRVPLRLRLEQPEILTPGARGAAQSAKDILAGGITVEPGTVEADYDYETLDLDAAQVSEGLRSRPRPEAGRVELEFDPSTIQDELEGFAGDLGRPPADAEVVPDGSGGAEVEPAEASIEPDPAEVLEDMRASVPEGQTGYTLPLRGLEPEVGTQEAEGLLPDVTLGEYAAVYPPDAPRPDEPPARLQNLGDMAGALDGTLVAPGESLSLNAVMEDAGVSLDSAGNMASGGADSAGASQLASALYRAGLLAGMEVRERHQSPGAPLPYADPGLEAYVAGTYTGAGPDGGGTEPDLVLGNPSSAYLLINAAVEEPETAAEDAAGEAVQVSVSGREGSFPEAGGPVETVVSRRAAGPDSSSAPGAESGTWVGYTESAAGGRSEISRSTYTEAGLRIDRENNEGSGTDGGEDQGDEADNQAGTESEG